MAAYSSEGIVLLPVTPQYDRRNHFGVGQECPESEAKMYDWAVELLQMGAQACKAPRLRGVVYPSPPETEEERKHQLASILTSKKKVRHLRIVVPGHSSPLGIGAGAGGPPRVPPDTFAECISMITSDWLQKNGPLNKLTIELATCNPCTPIVGTCKEPYDPNKGTLDTETLKQLIQKTSFAGRFLTELVEYFPNCEIEVKGAIGYYTPMTTAKDVFDGTTQASNNPKDLRTTLTNRSLVTMTATPSGRGVQITVNPPKDVLPVQPDWLIENQELINANIEDVAAVADNIPLELTWKTLTRCVNRVSPLWEVVRPENYPSNIGMHQRTMHNQFEQLRSAAVGR